MTEKLVCVSNGEKMFRLKKSSAAVLVEAKEAWYIRKGKYKAAMRHAKKAA